MSWTELRRTGRGPGRPGHEPARRAGPRRRRRPDGDGPHRLVERPPARPNWVSTSPWTTAPRTGWRGSARPPAGSASTSCSTSWPAPTCSATSRHSPRTAGWSASPFRGGTTGTLELARLMAVRGSVHATGLLNRPAVQKAAIVAAVAQDVSPLVADGRVRPVVDRRLPTTQAARAHRARGSPASGRAVVGQIGRADGGCRLVQGVFDEFPGLRPGQRARAGTSAPRTATGPAGRWLPPARRLRRGAPGDPGRILGGQASSPGGTEPGVGRGGHPSLLRSVPGRLDRATSGVVRRARRTGLPRESHESVTVSRRPCGRNAAASGRAADDGSA